MMSSNPKRRELALALVVLLAIVGAIAATTSANATAPASCGISGCVSTPPLSSSTTYSYTQTSIYSITSTSTTISTSISSSTTTTTATTISTSWSYTSTISTSVTSSLTITSISGTESTTNTLWSTYPTTMTTTSTYTVSSTSTGIPVGPACPTTLVTNGSPLAPYASFLRTFRDNQLSNTNAGRSFLITFNAWYYSWAPSLTYAATTNPWVFKTVQAEVYPLIGILYASYDAYSAVAPINTEAAAIVAGIVTASLMGIVYVAPITFVATRLLRRRLHRLHITKQITAASSAWFASSIMMCVVAYATGSTQLLAMGTSSMVLSMLSLGTMLGTKALTYAQVPLTNMTNQVLAFKRLTKSRL